MTISFACKCGARYRVSDEYAGKRTKCRACGESLIVPQPSATREPHPQGKRPAQPQTGPVPPPITEEPAKAADASDYRCPECRARRFWDGQSCRRCGYRAARRSIPDPDHFTPTVESWAKESVERSVGQTYDFYYKAFDTWPILHKAVAGECYKIIEQMISQGASLNQAHGSAGTPLFVAVLLGHTRMIEFLITNGAREGTNETLIASATGMGRSDLAELLRKLLPAQ